MRRLLLLAFVLAPVAVFAAGPSEPADHAPDSSANDYPTSARADYVFACMSANGGTQEALRRCSCSIDVIASILPYDRYEAADTVLSMRRQTSGYLAEAFRAPLTNAIVRELQEAQAEAEVRCF
jgi:hypothetical protein